MKEYRSRNSGRYVFNEDIHNLQDLALSPVELFKDAGEDFVLSGCAITVTHSNGIYTVSVASGFVYLDGKIRRVAAFSGTTALINTIGIYATQPTAPQITYFNGDTDFQYNDFAAEVKLNYDNVNSDDCIIAICDNSHYTFPGLRTFFKHYCLVNNGTVDHFGTASIDNADITSLAINGNNINDILTMILPLLVI